MIDWTSPDHTARTTGSIEQGHLTVTPGSMSTLGDDLHCVYPPDLRVENVQCSIGDMWIRVETKTRVAMSPTVQDVGYYYYFNNKNQTGLLLAGWKAIRKEYCISLQGTCTIMKLHQSSVES